MLPQAELLGASIWGKRISGLWGYKGFLLGICCGGMSLLAAQLPSASSQEQGVSGMVCKEQDALTAYC